MDRKTDRQTLFYRTLLAETGNSKTAYCHVQSFAQWCAKIPQSSAGKY